jgi:hypothetical protein
MALGTCKDCKFYNPRNYQPLLGSCNRWLTGYHLELSAIKSNEVLVESDEGWCMLMGPDFGCVLFEPKTKDK